MKKSYHSIVVPMVAATTALRSVALWSEADSASNLAAIAMSNLLQRFFPWNCAGYFLGQRLSGKIVRCWLTSKLRRWRERETGEFIAVRKRSGQLVVALAETSEAHREADAFFRSLEDDEGRGRTGAHLLDERVIHDHLGNAAIRQASHEPGAADIGLVDLQSESRGQQHTQRSHHPHKPAPLVGGLEHDHCETDIGAVFRGHALYQGALLSFGAGRGVAADLPVLVHRLDRALCGGPFGKGGKNQGQRYQREPHCLSAMPENDHHSIPRLITNGLGESPSCRHFISLPSFMPRPVLSSKRVCGPSRPGGRRVRLCWGQAVFRLEIQL